MKADVIIFVLMAVFGEVPQPEVDQACEEREVALERGHRASGDQSIIPLGVVISVPPSQDTEIYRPNPSPIYYFFDGINAMVEITSSRPPRQRNGPSS